MYFGSLQKQRTLRSSFLEGEGIKILSWDVMLGLHVGFPSWQLGVYDRNLYREKGHA